MKRAFKALLFLLVVGQSAPLGAQTTVQTKKATVTFSGRMDLNTVYRNDAYFTATKGDGTPTNVGNTPFVPPGFTNADQVGGAGTTDRNRSEFYMDPYLVLNFAIDVGDRTRGVIELRTPFVNPDAGGKSTDPNAGFFRAFQDRTLEVKQLFVEVDEIWSGGQAGEGLQLRVGIQDFKKDLRGDGNSFIIGTAGSEHPFDSVQGAPPAYSTGAADSTEPAGAYAMYNLGGILMIDGWIFSLDEGFNASDPARRDLLFWGFSGEMALGKKDARFGKVFFTVFDLMNTSDTNLITEGGGVVLYPLFLEGSEVRPIELFGEFYFQQGVYARDVATLPPLTSTRDIDQEDAFALNVGAKFKLPLPEIAPGKKLIPYVEASYVEVTGDDDATDDRNQNFVSLENNNRTLIVENGYYGYDIDANYRGLRLALGANVGAWSFEALYAYFELQDNSGGRVSGGATRSQKLGDEVDLKIACEVSANLKAALTYGWLFDSHALGQLEATQICLFQISLDF